MATIVSDTLAREICYQRISLDAFSDQLLAQGVSQSFAAGYIDIMRAKHEGMTTLLALQYVPNTDKLSPMAP